MAYTTPNWTDGASPAINATNLTDMGRAVELASPAYGVCSTAAVTAAKVVNVPYTGSLSLTTGLAVTVKFSNGNSASNPTLNVNGKGAVPIMSNGSVAATTWAAGQVITFVYDGTNWLYDGVDAYTKSQTLSGTTAAAIGAATGTTPTTPDEALAALLTAGSGMTVATGSYTGTGSEGPVSLNFSFVPKIVIVQKGKAGLVPGTSCWKDSFLWVYGQTDGHVNSSNIAVSFTQSGNTLSWFSTSINAMLNTNGTTYRWVAIG